VPDRRGGQKEEKKGGHQRGASKGEGIQLKKKRCEHRAVMPRLGEEGRRGMAAKNNPGKGGAVPGEKVRVLEQGGDHTRPFEFLPLSAWGERHWGGKDLGTAHGIITGT